MAGLNLFKIRFYATVTAVVVFLGTEYLVLKSVGPTTIKPSSAVSQNVQNTTVNKQYVTLVTSKPMPIRYTRSS